LLFYKELNVSDKELLDGQIYKTPIWTTIFYPWWGFILKFLIAYAISFLVDIVMEVFEPYSFYLCYIAIEVLVYNFLVRRVHRP